MIGLYREARARVRGYRVNYHRQVGIEEGTRLARSSHALDTAILVEAFLLGTVTVVGAVFTLVVWLLP